MVFSLTLTLRFFGCGKKTNIYFVLLWRFDEYGYPLIIIFITVVIINILLSLLLLLLLLLVLLLLLPFSLLQNYFNKSVNFFSEASKCFKIVFRSHYVICILPLYIGGKNKTGILKIFRPLFRKTWLRACVVMNHYNSFGCISNKHTFSTPYFCYFNSFAMISSINKVGLPRYLVFKWALTDANFHLQCIYKFLHWSLVYARCLKF